MTEYTLHESSVPNNNIIFYTGYGHGNKEVLRISTKGVTANPDMPVDEAADAVLRALDSHLKEMVAKALKQERNRLADALQKMPLNDTANSIAIWIREGGNA